jgi:hypothetical protein
VIQRFQRLVDGGREVRRVSLVRIKEGGGLRSKVIGNKLEGRGRLRYTQGGW